MRRFFALLCMAAIIISAMPACAAEVVYAGKNPDSDAEVASTISLPPALRVVAAETFYGTSSIRQVIVPEGATKIDSKAFAQSSLKEIYLPESIQSIADDAFEGCDLQLAIVSPGSYAEEYCMAKGIEYMPGVSESDFTIRKLTDTSCEITGYNGQAQRVYIPSVIQGLRVVSIAKESLDYNDNLLKVILPNGLKTIGSGALQCCNSLKEVVIPATVSEIGDYAFNNCISLAKADLPDGLTKLGTGAFYGCRITKAAIPVGITALEKNLFANCRKLQAVSLHENIASIGEGAFTGCSALTEIDLPASLKNIDRMAFSFSGLKSVIIPEGVTVIGDYAFNACRSLKEVLLPTTLETIEGHAFAETALVYAMIPEGTTAIHERAFWACKSLEWAYLPASLREIDEYAFDGADNALFFTERGCAALEYCKNNQYMIVLEPNAEQDFIVKNLTATTCMITGYRGTASDVYLPGSIGGKAIVEIAANAFRGKTHLKSISILNNSITSIGNYAFYGCTNLNYVQITDRATNIAETAFDGCIKLEVILVVSIAEEDAKAAKSTGVR